MKKSIAIIGGGAGALVLACELDPNKFEVSIYEKNAALGRKFLVAGEGGLNFTHSEDPIDFISRYTPASFLKEAFLKYPNSAFIKWMNALGVETFVGSSGRLFPKKGIKPIQVLEKILKKIEQNHVKIFFKYCWEGFTVNNSLKFSTPNAQLELKPDITVFCLGGASWKVTGSDGSWLNYFREKKIMTESFQSSNCAFHVKWEKEILSKIEGKTLKNCTFSCGNKVHAGEIVLTKFGMEGSGIYPLSPEIRYELSRRAEALVYIDFKPSFSLEKIEEKLNANSSSDNLTTRLKKELNLSETQVLLLKNILSKEEFLDLKILAAKIKKWTLKVEGIAPLDEAISTVGGISLEEIAANYELLKIKGNFVIGEMLDYDAPTGGYLLQSCFSMAKHLATHLNSTHSI